MAQYAILIYAHDSAHAPDATSADLEPCDDHSDELAASGSMLAAYALTRARARRGAGYRPPAGRASS